MSGHTLRYKCQCSWCASKVQHKIEAKNRPKVCYDSGRTEVAVTKIDELFDDGFLLHDQSNSLDKCQRWELVQEELERLSIETITTFNHKYSRWEKRFSIPIVGYRLFEDMSEDIFSFGSLLCMDCDGNKLQSRKNTWKTRNMESKFLLWDGKYYDTAFVHTVEGSCSFELGELHFSNRLKQLFSLKMEVPMFPAKQGIIRCENLRIHNLFRNRITNCEITESNLRASGWKPRNERDYIEIDLGENQSVTHIGTAGGFPALDVFPKKLPGSYKKKHWSKRNRANYVYVLRDGIETLSWVEEYELYYRSVVTNKWVLLGLFKGNSDATTEYINDLFQHYNSNGGLLTRYLRIKPTSNYHYSPTMRVAVYIRDQQDYSPTCMNTESTVLEQNHIITDRAVNNVNFEDKEVSAIRNDLSGQIASSRATVEYIYYYPDSTQQYSGRGIEGTFGMFGSWRDQYRGDPKQQKRNMLQKQIKLGIDDHNS